MDVFATLLREQLLAAGITQKAFAERVGRSYAFISKVARAQCGPSDDVETWAEALKLTGEVRERFLDAAALAISPPRVRDIVARLEKGPSSHQ